MDRFKSFTRGDVKTATQAVRHNLLRSLATITGIVIAVVSIILIVGIGEGVKRQVENQVNKLGKNVIMVRPGNEDSPLSGSLGSLARPGSAASLDHSDYETVKNTGGVQRAVPLSTVDGVVEIDTGDTSFNGSVVATTEGLLEILHQKVDYGAFFNENSSSARAVLGSNVGPKLFNDNIPLGRSFEFRGKNFVVTGVLSKFNSNPLLGDADFNNAIFIKYSAAQELNQTQATIYEILAQANPKADVDQVAESVRQNLTRDHRGNNDFTVLQQGKTVQATSAIVSLLTKFIVGAAIIALILGGIGVMNIMLVSVTERMHEIGVRKAVGATNNQVLVQFITESAILSFIGGVIGFVLGFALVKFLQLFTDLQPVMPWGEAILCVVAAVFVGALFGSFPALKAARKDPIDALRNE